MEDFLPVIGFIVYVVLQLTGLIGKKKKKPVYTEEDYPKKPKKTFIEQLEDLEKRLGEVVDSKGQEVEEPVYEKEEYKPLSEQIDRPVYQPISLEITEAPYSNLEEGIIDDVHKSKFPHHNMEFAFEKKQSKASIELFKKVSKKEAFIYSEIFNRKYFQVGS